jgi:manganese/iron transport system permease protein
VTALLTEPLGYEFFVRGLLAASIVGLVCAVVGSYMVLRGLVFMGDAISHSAFPGVVVAYLLDWPFYLGGAIAGIGTALAIGWISRRGALRNDTAIGVLFATMFALGIALFSAIPNYVGDLFGFLFGNVLGISVEDLVGVAILAAIVLVVVAFFWKELLYATFDPLGAAASGLPVARLEYLFLALIALTIIVSLQAVGIILVVAMLVTPAATAQLISIRFSWLMLTSVVIGIGSAIVGLYVSYWLNIASGATIVLVQAALFALAFVLSPRAGLLRRSASPSSDSSRVEPIATP